MRFTRFLFHGSARRGGAALIIALAFVVLLTGLVIAFFSRALAERQISNSSANGMRVDILAEGALATVLGDLRQEIAAGSTQTSPAAGVSIYVPKAATAAAPCLAGTTPSDNLPNLIKRSANNTPFFANTGSTTTYDTGNYPPSNRAASASSVAASQNGRTVSPARWNKPLLLPKLNPGSDTDFTPAGASATAWSKAPDWIVVARDGTNPTAWDASLLGNGTNPAVGRFAYNIYDEGGLLDANVAGCPTDVTVASPQGYYPAYKKALAFADLKQLPGISDLPSTGTPSRQEQVIRTLAGWRNYASTGIDPTTGSPVAGSPVGGSVGILPGYTWTSANVLNYLNFVQWNRTGFLRAANPLLVAGQSDRLLASRQHLISLWLNSVASQDAGATAERASLQNALQYLGTFTRGLNQPSYAPASNRPRIVAWNSASGGAGNDGYGGDDIINPSFLGVRVQTAGWNRFDGSAAVVGEPLVKKRFPLNRLAWLTCQGPSASRNGVASGNPTDADTMSMVTHGISVATLQQGTDANIALCFGLQWDPVNTRWAYIQSYPITTLGNVSGREPNFIELLKASVNAGAIAKSSTPIANPSPPTQCVVQASARDPHIDYAIIQLAANLIDQSNPAGVPTRIFYNNREFCGIKNLPYLNRVRTMVIKAVEAVPPNYTYVGGGDIPPGKVNSDPTPPHATNSDTLTNTGVGLAFYYPEVWNPHDWSPNNLAQTQGVYSVPTNFRVTATSDGPFAIWGYTYGTQVTESDGSTANAGGTYSNTATQSEPWTTQPVSPGFASKYFFSFTPGLRSLTLDNTSITFNVPTSQVGASLFREPTLLFRPNKPTNSNLAAPGLASIMFPEHLTQFGASGGGVTSAVGDNALNNTPGQGYIGFYLGAFPLNWVVTVTDSKGRNVDIKLGASGPRYADEAAPKVTFDLQYQDPLTGKWITYDEKYATPPGLNDAVLVTSSGGFFNSRWKNMAHTATVDPRTSRFAMMNGETFNGSSREQIPPFIDGNGWIGGTDNGEGVVVAQRMGAGAGATLFNNFGSSMTAWYFPGSIGWYNTSNYNNPISNPDLTFRPGLLTQNNPTVIDDGKMCDGDDSITTTFSQYYADPDGVVRRAMGAYVPSSTASATTTTGLPMTAANSFGGTTLTRNAQSASRPVILNRPFQSVAELGYAFSGTPWRNVDFFTPESGYAALLDVFCVNETDDAQALMAGVVDLNTRQAPVLQAILAGAYKDEFAPGTSTLDGATTARQVAQALVQRTTAGPASGPNANQPQPLANVSDLVGRWVSTQSASAGGIDGQKSYDGFSADLTAVLGTADPSLCYVQRLRESSLRALAASGQTRVWNLLIDVVAQTGRYPQGASGFDKFTVDGEQRYWMHVAIDRLTGQVIDRNLELVRE